MHQLQIQQFRNLRGPQCTHVTDFSIDVKNVQKRIKNEKKTFFTSMDFREIERG